MSCIKIPTIAVVFHQSQMLMSAIRMWKKDCQCISIRVKIIVNLKTNIFYSAIYIYMSHRAK